MRHILFIFLVLIPVLAFGGNGKKIAIDIPLFATNNIMLTPIEFEGFIASSGRFGYDFGLGLKFNATETFKVKAGLHYWNKPFKAEYIADITDYSTGNVFEANIIEIVNLKYFGCYARFAYEKKYFFIESGFDIAFLVRYKGDIDIYDLSGNFLGGVENSTESGLTDKFNIQGDFVVGIGPKVTIKEVVILKPTLQISFPVIPLFNTGAYKYNANGGKTELNLNGMLIKFGLNFEFEVGKEKTYKEKSNKPSFKDRHSDPVKMPKPPAEFIY